MIINLSQKQIDNDSIFRWEWSMKLEAHDGENLSVMRHCLLFSPYLDTWFREANIEIPTIETTEAPGTKNKYTYSISFKNQEDAILFKTTWL
jgi:hypothetical protein